MYNQGYCIHTRTTRENNFQYIGLAEKFVQTFPQNVMEKLKPTFWPTQHFIGEIKYNDNNTDDDDDDDNRIQFFTIQMY